MERDNNAPRLVLSMGDASGVGPEVIVRAWQREDLHRRCRLLVTGHAEVLRRTVRALKAPLTVAEIAHPDEPARRRGLSDRPDGVPPIACHTCCAEDILNVRPGKVDARAGQAAFDALSAATDWALAGHVDGIVTAPLSKAALHAAGHPYPGHTEILAEHCGVSRFAMMLYLPPAALENRPSGLSVVHATLHVALRDALATLSADRVVECCRLADEGLRLLGIEAPRIGVCAVNPHGGEDGLFGDEELHVIRPAVETARTEGILAEGPLPADATFVLAHSGRFDAVVAMYHDQGHIALKLLGMHSAVNVTLGLPITRTSPAHGTAMDIAGKGRADERGMVAAIETAAQLAIRRHLPGPDASSREVISSHAASGGGEYSNCRLSTSPPRLTS